VNDHDLLATSATVIPILLLVLAAQDRLGLVKQSWRSGWGLNAIALLLGALIVGEPIALGGMRHEPAPFWAVVYVTVVIGAALALMVWGIGWSIWYRYPDDVPGSGTVAKPVFWAIGAVVVTAIAAASAWAIVG
jgi:hypothetical protein